MGDKENLEIWVMSTPKLLVFGKIKKVSKLQCNRYSVKYNIGKINYIPKFDAYLTSIDTFGECKYKLILYNRRKKKRRE